MGPKRRSPTGSYRLPLATRVDRTPAQSTSAFALDCGAGASRPLGFPFASCDAGHGAARALSLGHARETGLGGQEFVKCLITRGHMICGSRSPSKRKHSFPVLAMRPVPRPAVALRKRAVISWRETGAKWRSWSPGRREAARRCSPECFIDREERRSLRFAAPGREAKTERSFRAAKDRPSRCERVSPPRPCDNDSSCRSAPSDSRRSGPADISAFRPTARRLAALRSFRPCPDRKRTAGSSARARSG
jgi:hypothetical protein